MAATTSSTSSALSLSGLASGINWTNIINLMATAESAPITRMQSQQTTLNSQNSALQTIGTDLASLQNDAKTLSSPGFFENTTTSISSPAVASATTSSGTPVGTYTFSVSQLASAAVQNGSLVSAAPISSTSDVSGVDLNSSSFAVPMTAGKFTIDGQTITVQATDSLQSVFTQINTATNGAVTASYDPTTDKINLTSSSPITLGSSADTSNFLEATQLFNNGTGSVTSVSPLAGININAAASQANLSTAINDGGSGSGSFVINGVTVDFSATQSVSAIMQAINNSGAGVTATYDGANNHFVLTNNSTGDVGMTMKDVSGNFLAATGLSNGTLQAGANLQYSINGSSPMTSESNTVNASPLGLTGLSITAQSIGSTSIAVTPDTNTIGTAINQFVTDYNAVQNYIKSQTSVSSSTTSTTGAVDSATTSTGVPGILMGNMDVEGISTGLRRIVDASPFAGAIKNLTDMGVLSNGSDNSLTASSLVVNDALANNLGQVAQLFSNSSSGIATQLSSYLTNTLSSTGVLASNENNLTTQSKQITASITTLQTKITRDETEMQNQFVLMEDAINKINVEKQYLNAYFSTSTSSQSAPTAAGTSSSSSSSA